MTERCTISSSKHNCETAFKFMPLSFIMMCQKQPMRMSFAINPICRIGFSSETISTSLFFQKTLLLPFIFLSFSAYIEIKGVIIQSITVLKNNICCLNATSIKLVFLTIPKWSVIKVQLNLSKKRKTERNPFLHCISEVMHQKGKFFFLRTIGYVIC